METTIESIKLSLEDLKAKLVSRTDPANVSVISKIPYKALEIREGLLYRAVDIADAACILFEAENLVSATCITRSFQETLAVLFYVNRKVKKAINDKDIDHLDESLMRVLMGSKNNPEMPDPINILTAIDKVDKEINRFRDIYDNLSELSHPNWAGTLGIYAKINKKKLWTDFGRNIRLKDSTRNQSLAALYASIELIGHIYDEFSEFLLDLVKVCEEKIKLESGI